MMIHVLLSPLLLLLRLHLLMLRRRHPHPLLLRLLRPNHLPIIPLLLLLQIGLRQVRVRLLLGLHPSPLTLLRLLLDIPSLFWALILLNRRSSSHGFQPVLEVCGRYADHLEHD